MKNTFIIALLWCFVSSTAQTKETNANQTPKDTLKEKSILLKEVIVTGNVKTDPNLTIVKSDFSEKVVQPKNSGELFSDINGFSPIRTAQCAI